MVQGIGGGGGRNAYAIRRWNSSLEGMYTSSFCVLIGFIIAMKVFLWSDQPSVSQFFRILCLSGQMPLLCDNSVIIPLKFNFENILLTSIYPDMWKPSNVTPIFKKGDEQLIKRYRPIHISSPNL